MIYESAEDLPGVLGARIRHDLERGGAVMLCVDESLAQQTIAEAGGPSPQLLFAPADERYARPIDALAQLWRFCIDATAAGATYVHSIGELNLDGDERDDHWFWYEAAVNDVLRDVDLRATCLYESSAAAEQVYRTHPTIELDGDARPSAAFDPSACAPPDAPVAPARPADLHLVGVDESRGVRAAMRDRAGHIPATVLDRALIIASELIANAVEHGGGASDVDVWLERAGITLTVTDHGPGIRDPYASLRPPDIPRVGAGLWLCHLESTRFGITRPEAGGTRVTAVIDAE